MNQEFMKKQEISPAKRARVSFPVVEGIGAAASIIGAPKSLLKSSKRAGCKAFLTGNRIDLAILIPFLFGMLAKGNALPAGIATPQDWLATEKAKREAIKRQQDENSLMPVADAWQQCATAWCFVFENLQRAENELPPALAGLSAVEIFERLHAFTERLRTDAKAKFEKVGQ
jgi:hypothetical protein